MEHTNDFYILFPYTARILASVNEPAEKRLAIINDIKKDNPTYKFGIDMVGKYIQIVDPFGVIKIMRIRGIGINKDSSAYYIVGDAFVCPRNSKKFYFEPKHQVYIDCLFGAKDLRSYPAKEFKMWFVKEFGKDFIRSLDI